MNAFEYAAPTTKEQAVSLLGNQWGETEILAGGTDLLSLMKDYLTTPKRVVNIKDIKELQGIKYSGSSGLRLGALVTLEELLGNATVKKEYPALAQAAEGCHQPADSPCRNGWRRPVPAAPMLVLPKWVGLLPQRRRWQRLDRRWPERIPRHPG